VERQAQVSVIIFTIKSTALLSLRGALLVLHRTKMRSALLLLRSPFHHAVNGKQKSKNDSVKPARPRPLFQTRMIARRRVIHIPSFIDIGDTHTDTTLDMKVSKSGFQSKTSIDTQATQFGTLSTQQKRSTFQTPSTQSERP
jgi:hypothetical protein